MIKHCIVFLFVTGTLTSSLFAGSWGTDFEAAKAAAAKAGVPILVNFTGSDWCGWCIKLDKEVFSKPEFAAFAKDNLVLLKVDFPRNFKLSGALRKHNEELASRYKVRGFPTILLLDAEGSVIASTGYRRGGAAAYVDHLKSLIMKNAE